MTQSRTSIASRNAADLYRIPLENRETYADLETIMDFIEAKFKTFMEGGSQYIVIRSISTTNLKRFDMNRGRSRLRFMTITFFEQEETLVIKFRKRLQCTARAIIFLEFYLKLKELGITLDVLRPIGSATQSLSGRLKKESDDSFVPYSTRGFDGCSSIVIGVGNMHSLYNLQVDARIWLENSSGPTISERTRMIKLEGGGM